MRATAAAHAGAPRPAQRRRRRRRRRPRARRRAAGRPDLQLRRAARSDPRELPKLAYGGGSYSGDKASRLAFLNGQVFHEGDTIAPGLVLKQVKQKGAILAYKGYRFEIGP
jgi:general secretion pathway protein B